MGKLVFSLRDAMLRVHGLVLYLSFINSSMHTFIHRTFLFFVNAQNASSFHGDCFSNALPLYPL